MRQALFFDGQNVLASDLTEIETSKSNELRRRLTDISLQMGIMTGLNVTNPVAFTLRVSAGTAYDVNGEACLVSTNQDVIVSALDVGKVLVIKYVPVTGTNVEHPITGILNATRRTDSFSLAMVVTPAADEIPLAELDGLTGGGTATIDLTVRVFWSPRIAPGSITDDMLDPNGDVITHINARGTGVFHVQTNPHALSPADIGFTPDATPTQHQQLDHEPGFETLVASAGKLTIDGTTAPDRLLIEQLQSGDNVLINGTRLIGGTHSFNPAIITFGAAPANPALFEVYADAGGVVTSHVIAQYSAPATVTGVQVIDIDPNHPAGTFTLTFDPSPLQLEWNSGGPFLLDPSSGTFNGDKDYTIFVGSTWIKVHVDFSSLPVGVQSDNITISARIGVSPLRLLLGQVNWSGSGTGFLGYGDWNTTGAALDKRPLGNLAFKHIADSFKNELYTRFSDADGHGWISGGNGGTVSGLQFRVAAGISYIGGKRIKNILTVLTLTDNTTNFVYLNESGQVVFSTFDPALVHANQPIVYLPAYRVVTSGGAITAITDMRYYFTSNGRNNVWTGTQTYRGSDSIVSGRRSVLEFITPSVDSKTRLYVGPNADANLELTVNSQWISAANEWQSDSGDPAIENSKITFDDDAVGINWFNNVGVNFTDASFKNALMFQSMEGASALGMVTMGAGYRASLADALKSRMFVEGAALGTSKYTLIASYKSGSSAGVVREYVQSFSTDAEFIRTFNARRVADTEPMWAADVSSEPMVRDHISAFGRFVYIRGAPGTTSPINESTFLEFLRETAFESGGVVESDFTIRNGRIQFSGTGTYTNPAATTGFTNTLVAKSLIKGWGNVTTGGGSPVLNDGFNIASVAYNGATGLTVNLAHPLDATTFPCVLGAFNTAGSIGGQFFVSVGETGVGFGGTQFFLHVRDTATNPAAETDLSGQSGNLGFLILGARTL